MPDASFYDLEDVIANDDCTFIDIFGTVIYFDKTGTSRSFRCTLRNGEVHEFSYTDWRTTTIDGEGFTATYRRVWMKSIEVQYYETSADLESVSSARASIAVDSNLEKIAGFYSTYCVLINPQTGDVVLLDLISGERHPRGSVSRIITAESPLAIQ
jgi:hypothetical protein